MTDALKTQIHAYLSTNPPGWCWEAKALALAESVIKQDADCIVELGVFGGCSLVPLAMAAKETGGFVWGIDPWNREDAIKPLDPVADIQHIDWWARLDINEIHNKAYGALWARELLQNCALIRTTGVLANPLFAYNDIEVLHIDGCHAEATAVADVELWLPKCATGAHVWMDDTNWPSTQKAVRLLEHRCEHLLTLINPDAGGETRLYRVR